MEISIPWNALLNELESRLGDSFKNIKAECYSEHKHGFYVYAKPNKCDAKNVIRYIGRYLGRPVIAVFRIDSCDGEMVTFHYNRHEYRKYVEETIPSIDIVKSFLPLVMTFWNVLTANIKWSFLKKAMSKSRGKRSSA